MEDAQMVTGRENRSNLMGGLKTGGDENMSDQIRKE